VRDLVALAVFETARPKSGWKYGAIRSLLERGVPEAGIAALIASAPWEPENRAKWHAQLARIARRTAVCPYCVDEPEADCRVAQYLASREARLTAMEVDLLG